MRIRIAASVLFALTAFLLLCTEAHADTNLVYACKTAAGVDGKPLGAACAAKTWTTPAAGKAVAACESTPCDLSSAIWRLTEKLAPGARVYRCSLNITPDVGGGASATLSACPVVGWAVYATAPPRKASVIVVWAPPTQNSDGTPLQDLAGYRIFQRLQTEDTWPTSITLANPGLVRYVINDLSTAETCFALVSFNTAGKDSEKTDAVCATPTVGGDVIVTIFVGTPSTP